MADIIHLLPDAVANQIAAGEVIQRPSSVIKELMENAIDADATRVQVFVEDAGKSCVQVIDNGKGMSETDARMAFERHATSKINVAYDLFALRTMGFRGEALASIAAVAQVELKTRTADDELGVAITIEGSRITGNLAVSCPKGANFAVRNLFFNVPARRKFLKSNTTEMNNIDAEFERIALAHPSVSFSLSSNNQTIHDLPSGSFRQRIAKIFGKNLDKSLIPVSVETDTVTIKGFVGSPDSSKRKGARQFFFANNRFMRHPYFARAIQAAYERLIPEGNQVNFFLHLSVDPETIDVNIHPTKTEIKFQNEQTIWSILHAAVREAIGKFTAAPTLDFDTDDKPNIPVFDPHGSVSVPKIKYDDSYNPFGKDYSTSHKSAAQTAAWTGVYADTYESMKGHEHQSPAAQTEHLDGASFFADEKPHNSIGLAPNDGNEYQQLLGRYILTPIQSGLLVIDQHRAHFRILYERYLHQMAEHRGITQGLLFPERIDFAPSEAEILEHILDDLTSVGFDLSCLGGGSYSILGVPTDINGLDPQTLLQALVAESAIRPTNVREEIMKNIAQTLAEKAALPIGQALSRQEMQNLTEQLLTLETPNYTPTGKLVLTIIKNESINQMFE